MSSVSDDLRKILMAGIGAVATTAEKTKEIVGELAKKGELTMDQGRVIVGELVKKGELTMDQGKVIIEELAKKGEKTMAQGKVLNQELRRNVKEKFKDISVTVVKKEAEVTAKSVVENLEKMTKEELDAIKAKIAEVEKPKDDGTQA